ncbi:hypothetical protein C8J56DRAFT_1003860 [Mycena floridula]|nr:hypothetical protein C8J56DRAFT_1003860 [Mycena floridula]
MSIFDVQKQLTFYGAYHTNPTNILIHIVCVPMILWSAFVLTADMPLPAAIPHYSYAVNEYLKFDLNGPTIVACFYLAYYYILEPVAALLYTPQMIFTVLSAAAFTSRPQHIAIAGSVHAFSWLAQIIGHGVAEGRAPALLDNLLGAVVLAPFFVHLEMLFKLGYRPEMYKRLNNEIGMEVTRIRKLEGDKKRAARNVKEL